MWATRLKLVKNGEGEYPDQRHRGTWKNGWGELALDLTSLVAVRGFEMHLGGAQPHRSDDPTVRAVLDLTLTVATGRSPGANRVRSCDQLRAVASIQKHHRLEMINPTDSESSAIKTLKVGIAPVSGWHDIPDDDPAKWSSLAGNWWHDDGRLAEEFGDQPEPGIEIWLRAPEHLFRNVWTHVMEGASCHKASLDVSLRLFTFHPEDIGGLERTETYAFERGCFGQAVLRSLRLDSVPLVPEPPFAEVAKAAEDRSASEASRRR